LTQSANFGIALRLQSTGLVAAVAELSWVVKRQRAFGRDDCTLDLSKSALPVFQPSTKGTTVTASLGQRRVLVHLTQKQVLLGGGMAFLLGGYFFASGWFDWASLFRTHPLLSIPCTLSLFVAPALLYISIRQMTEVGVRVCLLVSALLSATAIGLVAAGLFLWLQHWSAS